MATRKKTAIRTSNQGADTAAADELLLFIDNTSDLSLMGPSGQGRSVALNAYRKWKKGTYDPEKAVTLFGHLIESGAKRYIKEFANTGDLNRTFSAATRKYAAKTLEGDFRAQVERGEFDHLDKEHGARESRAVREPHDSRRGKPWPDWMILESVYRSEALAPLSKERAYELIDLGYIDASGTWELTRKGERAVDLKTDRVASELHAPQSLHASRGTAGYDDSRELREMLDQSVIVVAGEVKDNNSIDLADHDPVVVALVWDESHGVGHPPAAICVIQSQSAHPNEALEGAVELLTDWADSKGFEINPYGKTWRIADAGDFYGAIKNTKAEDFLENDIQGIDWRFKEKTVRESMPAGRRLGVSEGIVRSKPRARAKRRN